MLAVRDPSGRRTIAGIRMRDAGNVLRTVALARIRDAAGTLRTFYSALSATASPTFCSGVGDSPSAIDVTTQATTATPAGGVAPYTYAWSRTGGDTDVNALGPTAQTTGFQVSNINPSEEKEATFICTITDAAGSTAVTNAVTVRGRNQSFA